MLLQNKQVFKIKKKIIIESPLQVTAPVGWPTLSKIWPELGKPYAKLQLILAPWSWEGLCVDLQELQCDQQWQCFLGIWLWVLGSNSWVCSSLQSHCLKTWESVSLRSALRERPHGKTHCCSVRKALGSKLSMGTIAADHHGSDGADGADKGIKHGNVRYSREGCGSRTWLWIHTWPGLQKETVSNDHPCKYIKSKMQPSGPSPSPSWAACAWGLQRPVSLPLRLPECAM